MGATVSHNAKRFGVAFCDQLQRNRTQIREVRQRSHRIDDSAVNTGRDRRLCQTLADTCGDIESGCRILVFENSPVR